MGKHPPPIPWRRRPITPANGLVRFGDLHAGWYWRCFTCDVRFSATHPPEANPRCWFCGETRVLPPVDLSSRYVEEGGETVSLP